MLLFNLSICIFRNLLEHVLIYMYIKVFIKKQKLQLALFFPLNVVFYISFLISEFLLFESSAFSGIESVI